MKAPLKTPPLAMLRAFAAAGRRQSLRDAAAELGVTPSAVSHQVSALEAWVGIPLFDRAVRQVTLTKAGRKLSVALNAAFDDMAAALQRVRNEAEPTQLKVSALPLFTNAWLVPRLGRFEAKHPGVSITI